MEEILPPLLLHSGIVRACFLRRDQNWCFPSVEKQHVSLHMTPLAPQSVNDTKESEELEKCWITRKTLGGEQTDIWSHVYISKHFWICSQEQRLANCGLGRKPKPAHQLALRSKVLLEHSHSICWHTVYGYSPTIIAELNSCNWLYGPQSRKYYNQALYIKGLLSPDLESVMYGRCKLGWPRCRCPSPNTHHWRADLDICPPCGPQEGGVDPPQEPASSSTRHLKK